LRALADAGVMEIILTGGEPALHSRFADVLDMACSLFPRVMVQSNGTLFAGAGDFATLASRRIFCLNFSLHGPRTVHNVLTGSEEAFDATCVALRRAVEAGIRTASNLVLTSENTAVPLLEEVVALLAETGCREMTVTRFIAVGLGKGQPLAVGRDVFVQALSTLEHVTGRLGVSLLLANATPMCQLPESLHHLCNRCSFGFDKFYVDVRGNVMVCGMSRLPLGNLLKSPLRKILDSAPLYRRYQRLDHLPQRCRECVHLEICGGGCRAAALAFSKSIDGSDELRP
jgi:radical SAM protein with 4Fe4S-binding SPASM domain